MHKLSNRHTRARTHTHSLTVHPEDPVDGLQQEVHVVMDSDASEHIDLLCEALKTQRNKPNQLLSAFRRILKYISVMS